MSNDETREREREGEKEKRRERNGGREEETDGPGERGSGWLTNKRSFRSVAREYFMRNDERRSRSDVGTGGMDGGISR